MARARVGLVVLVLMLAGFLSPGYAGICGERVEFTGGSLPEGWTVVGGRWQLASDYLTSVGADDGSSGSGMIVRQDPQGVPQRIAALMLNTPGRPAGGASLVFNWQDPDNYYELRIQTYAYSVSINRMVDGVMQWQLAPLGGPLERDTWYQVSVETDGGSVVGRVRDATGETLIYETVLPGVTIDSPVYGFGSQIWGGETRVGWVDTSSLEVFGWDGGGYPDWTVVSGLWALGEGYLTSVGADSGNPGSGVIVHESPEGAPDRITALMLNTAGRPAGSASLIFNWVDADNYYELRLQTYDYWVSINRMVDGVMQWRLAPAPGCLQRNTWYQISVETEGDSVVGRVHDATGETLIYEMVLPGVTIDTPVFGFGSQIWGGETRVVWVETGDNVAPVVEAGQDQVLPADDQCRGEAVLDGGWSFDPDLQELTYRWTVPTVGQLDGRVVTVELPIGSQLVSLTVEDSCGATATDDLEITVEDRGAPVIAGLPQQVTAECGGPAGTAVALPAPTATDACEGPVPVTSDAPPLFPLGSTRVTWEATDSVGNSATAPLEVVVQDGTAPAVTELSASPAILWPPNHKMRRVQVTADAHDICDGAAAACRISAVSSSEPVSGPGSGNTSPDWEITGDLTVNLRAERSGDGPGRTYTLEVTCTDSQGNPWVGATTVTVPHDMG